MTFVNNVLWCSQRQVNSPYRFFGAPAVGSGNAADRYSQRATGAFADPASHGFNYRLADCTMLGQEV